MAAQAPDQGSDPQLVNPPTLKLITRVQNDGNQAQQICSAPAPELVAEGPAAADWSGTPEVVLASVFSLLPVLDRQNAASVCRSWKAACCHPKVWRHFDYGLFHPDSSVRKVNRLFEELRARHQQFLDTIDDFGSKFSTVRVVLFYPESFAVLQRLAERCRDVRVCWLRVYGDTQLSEDNKRVMTAFLFANTVMREVCFKNVEFSARNEFNSPFPLGPSHTRSLQKLSLVNAFRQNNLSALMYLVQVRELTLVPHQIRFAWLLHLASASLTTLNIVNMVGVWKFDFHILPDESWRQIVRAGPRLRVNCFLVDLSSCSKLLSPSMPLATLVCREFFNLRLTPLQRTIARYAQTLTTFVYFSDNDSSYRCLPHGSDDDVLSLVHTCPGLRTLAVKDGLHSSTLLLMVQLSPNFREPIVRQDMVTYCMYVPQNIALPQHVRDFAQDNCAADRFVPAMRQLLQREWSPLSRAEYSGLLRDRFTSW